VTGLGRGRAVAHVSRIKVGVDASGAIVCGGSAEGLARMRRLLARVRRSLACVKGLARLRRVLQRRQKPVQGRGVRLADKAGKVRVLGHAMGRVRMRGVSLVGWHAVGGHGLGRIRRLHLGWVVVHRPSMLGLGLGLDHNLGSHVRVQVAVLLESNLVGAGRSVKHLHRDLVVRHGIQFDDGTNALDNLTLDGRVARLGGDKHDIGAQAAGLEVVVDPRYHLAPHVGEHENLDVGNAGAVAGRNVEFGTGTGTGGGRGRGCMSVAVSAVGAWWPTTIVAVLAVAAVLGRRAGSPASPTSISATATAAAAAKVLLLVLVLRTVVVAIAPTAGVGALGAASWSVVIAPAIEASITVSRAPSTVAFAVSVGCAALLLLLLDPRHLDMDPAVLELSPFQSLCCPERVIRSVVLYKTIWWLGSNLG
jgi:hypothetical protein